ncbi:MAG TPA: hypothetical protein HA364_07765 [Thermoplasmata archaeon]|nr:hypothetical protein [Thermoplasmata archaeon]
MGEEIQDLIPSSQLGPWLGKTYDILMTDRRLVFIYIGKARAWAESRACHDKMWYVHASAQFLATRPGAFSVPYDSICGVRMEAVDRNDRGIHYLYLHYHEADGKGRKLKILIENPVTVKSATSGRQFHGRFLTPIRRDVAQLEYAIGIRHKLESILPLSALNGACWNLDNGRFGYVQDYLNGVGILCPICDADFGFMGVGLRNHILRHHPEYFVRTIGGTLMVGLSTAAAVAASATSASTWLLDDAVNKDATFFLFLCYVFAGSVCGILVASRWYRRSERRLRTEWDAVSKTAEHGCRR